MSLELAAENRQLREQLAQLLAQAQQNQQVLQRLQAFDLQFIAANGLRDLIDAVLNSFARSTGLDVVSLCLLDPDFQIRRILADLGINQAELPHLLFLQEEGELGELAHLLSKPVLGGYDEQMHKPVFPRTAPAPLSIAILPLIRHGRLIGCLSFGSGDDTHFVPNMATDFIQHLASIVAICFENVVNVERLKHIGLTDPLTGVHNRRYVERRLVEEIGRSRRQGYALSCLYIDIDHFKQINDRLGHQAGDEVLRGVAERIKAELRLSDALGRFGGEEFVVLLIDAALTDAVSVAERIRQSVAQQPVLPASEDGLEVTVSIGVAALTHSQHYEPVEVSSRKFIALADQALYLAKEGGRNRVATSA